jgi:hypothetical protein
MKAKTVVVDLDGVIAHSIEGRDYENCVPNTRMIRVLDLCREAGHVIVISTARWAEDKPVTERWLARYEVPYDYIYFDKPLGDIYIDDKAMRERAADTHRTVDTIFSDVQRRLFGG